MPASLSVLVPPLPSHIHLHPSLPHPALKVLEHVESTSPECVLYPGQVGLNEPTPAQSEVVQDLEGVVRALLGQQHQREQEYIQEAFLLPRSVTEP